jgi:two-component sensor histidine kinase
MQQKETRVKELHHRVKNNLQLILSIVRLQRNREHHQEKRDVLNAFEQRVATIAGTHEILLQEERTELVEMHKYLETLCKDLMDAFSREQLAYRCDSDIRLPLREAVYVGLIVNELVTNIFKHSIPDKESDITLGLHEDRGVYLLQLDTPYQPQKKRVNGNGLGQIIVKTLVEEQLGGTIETHSDGGGSILIRFQI